MPDRLDHLITPAQRAAICAPIAQARTFPRQAFTSEAFFEVELERIFSRQWTALCFSQQVVNSGDLLPVEFAGIPLLLVRGDDAELRVFHNIVPYDGCLAVIDAAEAQTEIVTPYHGWRYDLSGKLLEIPYWHGAAGDLASLGHSGDLVAVRSKTELGVVFIDLSGTADDFDSHIKPLRACLADYRLADLAISEDKDGALLLDPEDLATNWKTHYENWAINVLHENFTHEIYADSAQIPRVNGAGEKTYVEHIDGPLMGLSYLEQEFAETYELEELPFKHLGVNPEALPARSFIGSFFPNLHVAVFPYFIHVIIALPVSAGQTRTLRAQFYDRESASDPDFLEDRLNIMADFHQAGEEDGRITEAVQKARRSPVCTQQFYSPFWDNMHYRFSNTVLAALEQN